MLLIAKELDKLFHINILVVRIEMSLRVHSGVVDQVVGVGNHSGDSAENMVVDFVKLAGLSGGHEELAGLLLLGAEDNAVLGEDTDNGTILIDVLDGILNLQ